MQRSTRTGKEQQHAVTVVCRTLPRPTRQRWRCCCIRLWNMRPWDPSRKMVTTSTCPGVRGGCENVDVSGARKKVVAVARKQVEVVPENTCLKRTTVQSTCWMWGDIHGPFPTATSKHSPERHVRNLVGRGRGRGPLCHDNQREKGRHGFKVRK